MEESELTSLDSVESESLFILKGWKSTDEYDLVHNDTFFICNVLPNKREQINNMKREKNEMKPLGKGSRIGKGEKTYFKSETRQESSNSTVRVAPVSVFTNSCIFTTNWILINIFEDIYTFHFVDRPPF